MTKEKKNFAVRLRHDTADWVEEYAERQEMTKSDVLRMCVEREQHRDQLAERTRARQAKVASTETLTLAVSTLTLILVGAVVFGGGI